MTEHIQLNGPFYVELVYEHEDSDDGERTAAAYIDGFESEEDAWSACQGIRKAPIDAINAQGGGVTIAPEQLLQMLIARRSLEEAAAASPV